MILHVKEGKATSSQLRKFTCGGFSMISAIFLLVVMASLGAAMLNFSSMQNTSSALDVQGARAYQAARAGIEWGMFQILQNSATCSAFPSTFTPSATTTLSGFTVTVLCTSTVVNNVITPFTIYQIQSTACSQPNSGTCPDTNALNRSYVERQLQITISK